MDSGERIDGQVTRVSKFRITVKLTGVDKEKVLYKSHIRWHKVV